MIFLDVTKTRAARHHSGLTRVTSRLAAELGSAARPVIWPDLRKEPWGAGDWFLTAELFSEEERPGWSSFLESRRFKAAAIFHDAIPLKHPHVTWPQSVARHPGYMKLLARFDRVWAVSGASRDELQGFWRWQGLERTPPVDVLHLGADFMATPRRQHGEPSAGRRPQLLCLGILEPRKNQDFLLEVCGTLWAEGIGFDLHLVGRINPHFGRPIAARIDSLARREAGLRFHAAAPDPVLAVIYEQARTAVFPSIAEGCGLPLLEALWMGVPCVCSDLPALRENAAEGGCLLAAPNDRAAWESALRRVITDDAFHAELQRAAQSRPLPTWRETADALQRGMLG